MYKFKRNIAIFSGLLAIAAVAFIFLDALEISGLITVSQVGGLEAVFGGGDNEYALNIGSIISYSLLLGGGLFMLLGGRFKLFGIIGFGAMLLGSATIFLEPMFFAYANNIYIGEVASIAIFKVEMLAGPLVSGIVGLVATLFGGISLGIDAKK